MLVIRTKNGYRCGYCRKEYKERKEAVKCEEKHDLALVPIAKEDLNRLLLFIFRKDERLLSQNLIRILQKYNSRASLRRK
jgi:hypothetical protein